MSVKRKPKILKFSTDCCALCQLSITNQNSIEEINRALSVLKRQSESQDYLGTDKLYGQKAVFVITTPHEIALAENLKTLGFKSVFNFERRKGYPEGTLTMWCINI